MKKSIFILIAIISLATINLLMAQKNAIRINTGYAIGKVDKRYAFLKKDYAPLVNTVKNKINDNTPDDEYTIGLGYAYTINKRLIAGFDLGYATLIQDFLLPVESTSYFKVDNEKLYWRRKSYYHILQLSPIVQYLIISKTVSAGVYLQAIGNISFRKVVQDGNLSRNKTEYFSNEVYPGIFAEYNRFKATLGVRALHWKYRDDAIANNGLNPDKYNPFKMKFTLSYDIYRW